MEVCLYNDFAFKWLFGREQKKKPIISLLNAVVGAENNETVFSDIRIPTPFDATKFAEEKQGILDLRVKDELTGTWGDVEIQVRYQHYYPERAMYYLAGMYREQLIAGNNYLELRPCYGVHFLVADFFPNESEWLNHYKLLNVKNQNVLSEQWQFYFVELEKFNRTKEDKASWKILEQWCDFLLKPRDPDKPLDKHLQNNPAIEEVHEMLQEFIQDEQLRAKYRARQEWLRDQRTMDKIMREQKEALEKERRMRQEERRIREEAQIKLRRSVLGLKKFVQSDKEIAGILGVPEKEVREIINAA